MSRILPRLVKITQHYFRAVATSPAHIDKKTAEQMVHRSQRHATKAATVFTAVGRSHQAVHVMKERVTERGAQTMAGVALEMAEQRLPNQQVMNASVYGYFSCFESLRVLLPLLGAWFVIHTARHDTHRCKVETARRNIPACVAFGISALMSWLDALAHVSIAAGKLLQWDHKFMHTVEHVSLGLVFIATLCALLGEIDVADGDHKHKDKAA
jgi:hypothetical protein